MPAVIRHGELSSPAATNGNVFIINFQHLDAGGIQDSNRPNPLPLTNPTALTYLFKVGQGRYGKRR